MVCVPEGLIFNSLDLASNMCYSNFFLTHLLNVIPVLSRPYFLPGIYFAKKVNVLSTNFL